MVRVVSVACLLTSAAGHAWITEPPSRTGATLAGAGLCPYGSCLWFSQSCTIGCPECGGIEGSATCGEQQGAATLPHEMRTYNLKSDCCGVNPWCAPGSSPVMNPCGVSAGGDKQGSAGNGNDKPPGYDYGALGTEMRNGADEHRIWKAGEAVDVAFAIVANHGGGYQYRLCPKDAEQTEECFQRTPLEFVGDDQWIQYCSLDSFNPQVLDPDTTPDGFNGTKRIPPSEAFPKCDLSNRQKIPAKRLNVGTIPKGSTWARNPIPACDNVLGGSFNFGCHVSSIDGKYPIPTADKFQFVPPGDDLLRPGLLLGGFGGGACGGCNQPEGNNPPDCDKFGKLGRNNCTEDESQAQVFQWSVVDKVLVPDIPPGEYVVSFRWDCEQTPQIWQQCSDVTIVAGNAVV